MDSLTSRFEKEVYKPYLELLKAQYCFHPTFKHAMRIWEDKLTLKELVKGPYLEKSQIYKNGDPLTSLSLHSDTVKTVREVLKKDCLWAHQTNALKLLLDNENAVIATGTSSGKTFCYQIPILNDLIKDQTPGLRAIIIYPLNALVNDQLEEWKKFLKYYIKITFARFTGQTPISQEEYVERKRKGIEESLSVSNLSSQELNRRIKERLTEELRKEQVDIPNLLNHRDAIRASPPHILITNFSMLEYILERPVDVPIFKGARLKFLVLDEVHSYRGIQSTEIAFLLRRLKERVNPEKLTCIATSATLGDRGDPDSHKKVIKFVQDLFGESFHEKNPIYGEMDTPQLKNPSVVPLPDDYIQAIEEIKASRECSIYQNIGSGMPLADKLLHDENLYKLRKDILGAKPCLLSEAAVQLWPNHPHSIDGLQAMLEITAAAKADEQHEDLLPTRLHYFIRAQDGFYICLNPRCPGRKNNLPSFFLSRQNLEDGTAVPVGDCPDCFNAHIISKLVEVITCRKCGYLFGALQEVGPRLKQIASHNDDKTDICLDSFSTELGWASDSFWTYFSIENELPYPKNKDIEGDHNESSGQSADIEEINWCASCGKKITQGAGDKCICSSQIPRKINILHRQCESPTAQTKKLLKNALTVSVRTTGTNPSAVSKSLKTKPD